MCKTSLSYEAGDSGAERSDRRGACWTSSDTRTRNLSLMVSPILVYSMLVIRWCSYALVLVFPSFFPCLFNLVCLHLYSMYFGSHRLIQQECVTATPTIKLSKQGVTLDEPLWYGGMCNGQI